MNATNLYLHEHDDGSHDQKKEMVEVFLHCCNLGLEEGDIVVGLNVT